MFIKNSSWFSHFKELCNTQQTQSCLLHIIQSRILLQKGLEPTAKNFPCQSIQYAAPYVLNKLLRGSIHHERHGGNFY